MVNVPRILIGNYGNGTFGIKTSLPGNDVTVLADDDDITKRSFNSQWENLAKIKIIGVAQSDWTQFQSQTQDTTGGGVNLYHLSNSGWTLSTPIQVPTGLTYIPIWEERVVELSTGVIYDDNLQATSGPSANGSFSGARSCFTGPGQSPANTILMMPYLGNPSGGDVVNTNTYGPIGPGTFGYWPPYPAYPAKPTLRPASVYVIYSNKMGDIS